jgi:hypothetical protein
MEKRLVEILDGVGFLEFGKESWAVDSIKYGGSPI